MAKIVTIQDYMYSNLMSSVNQEKKEKAKAEKKEKVKKTVSFFAGILLYWIACIIITAGFFALALMSL